MAMYAFNLLAAIPNFDGKAEEISSFIQRVEEVRSCADIKYIRIFDLRIRTKIVGYANVQMINNNSPTNWEEIKNVLTMSFGICLDKKESCNVDDSYESISVEIRDFKELDRENVVDDNNVAIDCIKVDVDSVYDGIELNSEIAEEKRELQQEFNVLNDDPDNISSFINLNETVCEDLGVQVADTCFNEDEHDRVSDIENYSGTENFIGQYNIEKLELQNENYFRIENINGIFIKTFNLADEISFKPRVKNCIDVYENCNSRYIDMINMANGEYGKLEHLKRVFKMYVEERKNRDVINGLNYQRGLKLFRENVRKKIFNIKYRRKFTRKYYSKRKRKKNKIYVNINM